VPAALAACLVTTIRTYTRTKGWDVDAIAADVVYDHKSTPRRFDVAIHIPAGLSELQRQRILRVAEACPVRAPSRPGSSCARVSPSPTRASPELARNSRAEPVANSGCRRDPGDAGFA
jgi:hypothetical protein